jgi:hypothetical protein
LAIQCPQETPVAFFLTSASSLSILPFKEKTGRLSERLDLIQKETEDKYKEIEKRGCQLLASIDWGG